MKNLRMFIIGFFCASAIFILMGASKTVTAVLGSYSIFVNGEKVQINAQPVNINGSVFVPLRALGEMFKYQVEYEAKTKGIYLSNNGEKYVNNIPSQESKSEKVVMKIENLKEKYSLNGKLNFEQIKKDIQDGKLDKDSQDAETGDTLVILAIKENNFPLFDFLAKNGADLEKANNNGETPLHVAVFVKSNFYVGQLVNNYKVNTKIQDNNKKIPFDYTEEDSVNWLLLKSAK